MTEQSRESESSGPYGTRYTAADIAAKRTFWSLKASATLKRYDQSANSARFCICATLLCVCVIFGGGGSPAIVSELGVELSAIVAAVAWAWMAQREVGDFPLDRKVLTGCALFALLPAVQLIPLPPSVWQSLPGRAVEIDVLRVVGSTGQWMPISVAPAKTLASCLSLIPPFAILYFSCRLSCRQRTDLIGVVAVLALVTVLAGVVQVSSGDSQWLRFYAGTRTGFLTGFQANRNSTADVLALGLIALVTYLVIRRDLAETLVIRLIWAGCAISIAIAAVLTGSRAGLAMIAIASVGCSFLLARRFYQSRHFILILVAGMVALGGGIALLWDNPALEKTWSRLGSNDDKRVALWKDTEFAIAQYWPVGSGVGTFTPAFLGAEELENVSFSRPNRAHNDILEYVLEGGALAIALLTAGTAFIAIRIRAIARRSDEGERRRQLIFAATSLVILVTHSLVDYPIRSISISAIAAVVIGLLARDSAWSPDLRTSIAPSLNDGASRCVYDWSLRHD